MESFLPSWLSAASPVPRISLQGKKGLLEAMGDDQTRPELMVKGLGNRYQILKNTFKPYAACLLTHPTIDAIIGMRNKYNLQPGDIKEVSCDVAKFCLDSAGQVEPKTGLAGKFSTYYCAALALAEGVAGENMFTDKRVLDPKMVALEKKGESPRCSRLQRYRGQCLHYYQRGQKIFGLCRHSQRRPEKTLQRIKSWKANSAPWRLQSCPNPGSTA